MQFQLSYHTTVEVKYYLPAQYLKLFDHVHQFQLKTKLTHLFVGANELKHLPPRLCRHDQYVVRHLHNK